jgi:hypothetical protein
MFKQSNTFYGNSKQTNIFKQVNYVDADKNAVVIEKHRDRSRSPVRRTVINIGQKNGDQPIMKQTNVVHEGSQQTVVTVVSTSLKNKNVKSVEHSRSSSEDEDDVSAETSDGSDVEEDEDESSAYTKRRRAKKNKNKKC